MEYIPLETLCQEDLHCLIIPKDGIPVNNLIIYPTRFTVGSSRSYNINVNVLRSPTGAKIGIGMNEALQSAMRNLDTLMKKRAQEAFSNRPYRSFVNQDSSFVFFDLKCHPTCLDVEVFDDDNDETQLFGFWTLEKKLNHKCLNNAFLLFDFPCFFVEQGEVCCNPRLLKLSYFEEEEGFPKAFSI